MTTRARRPRPTFLPPPPKVSLRSRRKVRRHSLLSARRCRRARQRRPLRFLRQRGGALACRSVTLIAPSPRGRRRPDRVEGGIRSSNSSSGERPLPHSPPQLLRRRLKLSAHTRVSSLISADTPPAAEARQAPQRASHTDPSRQRSAAHHHWLATAAVAMRQPQGRFFWYRKWLRSPSRAAAPSRSG